ncbi:hypothetical protein WDV93_02015 [Pantoea ananatis]
MLFYGMSSESAMKRHAGSVAEYRAAEGKTVKLPLRGPVRKPSAISLVVFVLPAPMLALSV